MSPGESHIQENLRAVRRISPFRKAVRQSMGIARVSAGTRIHMGFNIDAKRSKMALPNTLRVIDFYKTRSAFRAPADQLWLWYNRNSIAYPLKH